MNGPAQPRWVWPTAAVWVVASVVVGEVLDPPVDWVRVGVRLALGALTAWVVVNIVLSASNRSTRRKDD